MMRMGDRHRQRVGRVGAGELHTGEQMTDHRLHLLLVRAAGADGRLLDDAGMIFADDQSRLRRSEQDDAARLAQFQR